MGVYVNDLVSIASFEKLRNKPYYVDKSKIIKMLEELVAEASTTQHFCIPRPERFGKTSVLHLLNAYYCKKSSCDSEKFSYINGDFHKFNVISLNMVGDSKQNYIEFIRELSSKVVDDLKSEFPEYAESISDNCCIDEAVNIIISKSCFKEKFILLIDDWDYYIKHCKLSEDEEMIVWEFYNSLTKGKADFYFSIFFGRNPRYPSFAFPLQGGNHSKISLANNINDGWFLEYIGFTIDEVSELFDRYDIMLEKDEYPEMYHSIGGRKIMGANTGVNLILNLVYYG